MNRNPSRSFQGGCSTLRSGRGMCSRRFPSPLAIGWARSRKKGKNVPPAHRPRNASRWLTRAPVRFRGRRKASKCGPAGMIRAAGPATPRNPSINVTRDFEGRAAFQFGLGNLQVNKNKTLDSCGRRSVKTRRGGRVPESRAGHSRGGITGAGYKSRFVFVYSEVYS